MFRSANFFSRVCLRLITKKNKRRNNRLLHPSTLECPIWSLLAPFPGVTWVFSGCYPDVFWVYPGCSPGVSWVFPYGVFLHGLIMARFCQNVRSLFCQLEICIQPVPLIWATLYGLGCLIEFETPCKYVVGMYVVVATFS